MLCVMRVNINKKINNHMAQMLPLVADSSIANRYEVNLSTCANMFLVLASVFFCQMESTGSVIPDS